MNKLVEECKSWPGSWPAACLPSFLTCLALRRICEHTQQLKCVSAMPPPSNAAALWHVGKCLHPVLEKNERPQLQLPREGILGSQEGRWTWSRSARLCRPLALGRQQGLNETGKDSVWLSCPGRRVVLSVCIISCQECKHCGWLCLQQLLWARHVTVKHSGLMEKVHWLAHLGSRLSSGYSNSSHFISSFKLFLATVLFKVMRLRVFLKDT